MNTIFENWKIDLQYQEWLESRPFNEGRSKLTLAQAAELLGVQPNADKATAKKAYYAQMKKHHPDRGGDKETAMSVNAAWAILSGEDTPAPGGPSAGGGSAEEGTFQPQSELYAKIKKSFENRFSVREGIEEASDSAGWPTNPPEHPKGSSGVCIQQTRSGTKKLYKGDEGYEDCVKSKKSEIGEPGD